jgi:hypothetical protein
MTRSATERYHIAQLEKAASMTRLDLDHLTAGELAKLQTDLYEFVSGSDIGLMKIGRATPVDKIKPEERFKKIVPEHYIRGIIGDLKKRILGIAGQQNSFFVVAEISNGKLDAFVADPSSQFKLTWRMPPNEGAQFALLLHLAGSGLSADRIRLCPLPRCGNVFVLKSYARADREHYCSVRCSRNAATQRYRQKKSKPKMKRGPKKGVVHGHQ